LRENLIIENESRLEIHVDESNNALLEKKNIIEDLRFNFFELESKMKEYESQLKEIGLLKVKL
jgi:hypothetical protein